MSGMGISLISTGVAAGWELRRYSDGLDLLDSAIGDEFLWGEIIAWVGVFLGHFRGEELKIHHWASASHIVSWAY